MLYKQNAFFFQCMWHLYQIQYLCVVQAGEACVLFEMSSTGVYLNVTNIVCLDYRDQGWLTQSTFLHVHMHAGLLYVTINRWLLFIGILKNKTSWHNGWIFNYACVHIVIPRSICNLSPTSMPYSPCSSYITCLYTQLSIL